MSGTAQGPLASHVGQLVLVVVHRGRPLADHQLVVLHGPQQLVHQNEGQLHLLGDVAADGVAPGEEELDGQGLDLAVGQSGRGE